MKMGPKPFNLTSKNTSVILLIKLLEQMQTLIAVKSFVVLNGLQGNSSQVVILRKWLNFSISLYPYRCTF